MSWPRIALVAAVCTACAALAVVLALAMLALPPRPNALAGLVVATTPSSGVAHPVTAVLLNFRGYDTLLEIAVLLAAGFGILACRDETASPPLAPTASVPLLQSLARLLTPPAIVVAGYLLWHGAYAPGGAFQAAAVLGAAGVLLNLSGLAPGWGEPGLALRCALGAGFALFVAVAAWSLPSGALLRYSPEWAGLLILLIESGLTISLGLVLAGLFLWQPVRQAGAVR